ncbi:unnamed protein product [Rhizophagus irregularis]|nr:unnamed protein product [Rhizophagus irregularis]
MSHKRRGCIHHQRNLLKFKAFKDIKPKNDKKTKDTTDLSTINANLLYRRWQSVLKEFSPTGWVQPIEKRFQRSCRRIFNTTKPQPERTRTMADNLAIATHTISDANDYRFLVPYFVHNRPIPVAPPEIEVDSIEESTTPINPTSSTPILYTVEPYNPIPDMFIPTNTVILYRQIQYTPRMELLLYQEPKNGSPICQNWGRNSPDRRRQEILQIDHCQQQDNIERDTIAKARKEEAALLGTSVKRLDTRCVAIDCLTSTADIFHENMVKFTEKKAINAGNIKRQKK